MSEVVVDVKFVALVNGTSTSSPSAALSLLNALITATTQRSAIAVERRC